MYHVRYRCLMRERGAVTCLTRVGGTEIVDDVDTGALVSATMFGQRKPDSVCGVDGGGGVGSGQTVGGGGDGGGVGGSKQAKMTKSKKPAAASVGAKGRAEAGKEGGGLQPASASSSSPRVAPVRCVEWCRAGWPRGEGQDSRAGEGYWLAWGDDAGFLRFQRFRADGFKATEAELLAAERYC